MAFSRDRATVIDYNCNNNRSMGPFNRQEAIRMNRKCLSLAIVAFLICVLPLAAAAAQFQADMTMDGGGEKVTGKVFVSGSIMRQEMQVPGGEVGISIIDGVKNVMYVLITQEKMYMEFPNENIVLGDRDVEELLADEADLKKLGTETVEGYKCDKYEVTYKDPERQKMGNSVIWIAQKLNFTIKGVTDGEQGKITVLYTNIKEGPQDASLFEIPKDYQKFAF